MAKRYCGSVELDIRLRDDSETYTVRYRELGAKRFAPVGDIKLSPFLRSRIAADSSVAYDHVAQAALSFATYDSEALYELLSMSDEDGGRFSVYRMRPIPALEVSQDEHEEEGLDALRAKEMASP